MSEKIEEKFPIFIINNCSCCSAYNLNIKNNVYAIPVLCYELIGWCVYEEIGFSTHNRNNRSYNLIPDFTIQPSQPSQPSQPQRPPLDESISEEIQHQISMLSTTQIDPIHQNIPITSNHTIPLQQLAGNFTVTCDCGVTATYRNIPRETTRMPCGNPNHFAVRYTNTNTVN